MHVEKRKVNDAPLKDRKILSFWLLLLFRNTEMLIAALLSKQQIVN